MSGLILKLAPGERVIINGAMLENGDKPSSLRVADPNARVLRCRDALKPDEIDTPVKQIYYAIQLLITGDLQEDNVLPAIMKEIDRVGDVFETVDPTLMVQLRDMMRRGNHYSALCHLRHVMDVEAELLTHARLRQQFVPEAKVA
jgi:flagellar protein FlbT